MLHEQWHQAAHAQQIDVDALNDVMAKLPTTMDAVAQLQQQLNSVASFLGNVGSIFG